MTSERENLSCGCEEPWWEPVTAARDVNPMTSTIVLTHLSTASHGVINFVVVPITVVVQYGMHRVLRCMRDVSHDSPVDIAKEMADMFSPTRQYVREDVEAAFGRGGCEDDCDCAHCDVVEMVSNVSRMVLETFLCHYAHDDPAISKCQYVMARKDVLRYLTQ
jgi:hypothetical protein